METKELANKFYKERDTNKLGFQRVKQLSAYKNSMDIKMVEDAF